MGAGTHWHRIGSSALLLWTPQEGDNFLYTEATITFKPLPLPRRSVFELLPQRLEYHPRLIHKGFMVWKSEAVKDFSPSPRFPLLHFIPQFLRTHSFIFHQSNIVLAIYNVIKHTLKNKLSSSNVSTTWSSFLLETVLLNIANKE